jgi:hypothetical protein
MKLTDLIESKLSRNEGVLDSLRNMFKSKEEKIEIKQKHISDAMEAEQDKNGESKKYYQLAIEHQKLEIEIWKLQVKYAQKTKADVKKPMKELKSHEDHLKKLEQKLKNAK